MICVFSGTGNSLFAARRLAEVSLHGERITLFPATPQFPPGERIVWVFPVYSWGIPPVVLKWIDSMDLSPSAEHFALLTCGDDCGYAARQLSRVLNRKGCRLTGAHSVFMPNTYVLMKGFDTDSPELADRKLAEAPQAIDSAGHAIEESRKGDFTHRGRFPWFKSAVIYPWFVRFAMSPKPFHALPDCVGCGICSRSCPLGNIAMDNRRPKWGDNCALCLRCYHFCPHHSVAYGKATRGKSRYARLAGLFTSQIKH